MRHLIFTITAALLLKTGCAGAVTLPAEPQDAVVGQAQSVSGMEIPDSMKLCVNESIGDDIAYFHAYYLALFGRLPSCAERTDFIAAL